MNSIKRALLGAVCSGALFGTAANAQEFSIDRLFVVGDSLSDLGTYSQAVQAGAALAGQTVPPIQYRFTTNNPDGSSQNYSEVVADLLGIDPIQPNLITGVPAAAGTPFANDVNVGGTNFAQGGARVALPALNEAMQAPLGITQTNVMEQVNRLLASTPSFIETDLVILWAGNNDVLAGAELAGAGTISPGQAVADVTVAAQAMVAQVDRVLEHGPATVVVVTVPDIGESTPLGVGSPPLASGLLSTLSSTFNSTLSAGVGGRVNLVDSGAVLNEVLANPVAFGFSDINQLGTFECPGSALNCVTGGPGTANDGLVRVFADPIHPSNLTNSVLGQLAFNIFPGVGQVGVLPVATISGLRQQSIGLESRLNLGAFFIGDEENHGQRIRRPVGNLEVYGGAEVGFYESDAQQIVPGFDANTQITKVAADVVVAPNVLVGVGGSFDIGQVDFADGRGGFDERLFIGAIFGVAQIIPGVYVNGVLGGGLIDVTSIDRNFDVNLPGGQVNRQSFNAESDGNYIVARTNLGAVLPLGNGFFINPSVGIGFERVSIDGYSETASDGSLNSVALTVGDLEYEGYRGTAALAGFYRPPSAPSWTFGLRGSWEHDFNDDDIEVPFAAGTSPLATQIAPRPDDSYAFLSANIAKELGPNSVLNLQGSTNFFQEGVDGYTISLVYKHTF